LETRGDGKNFDIWDGNGTGGIMAVDKTRIATVMLQDIEGGGAARPENVVI